MIVGIVYFIRSGSTGEIKIGKTATSARSRAATLQTGNPEMLHVLATVPDDSKTEAQLHHRFRVHRRNGEWFAPAPEILAFIEGVNAAKPRDMDAVALVLKVAALEAKIEELNEALSWHREAEIVHGRTSKEVVIEALTEISAEMKAERVAANARDDAQIEAMLAGVPYVPPAAAPTATRPDPVVALLNKYAERVAVLVESSRLLQSYRFLVRQYEAITGAMVGLVVAEHHGFRPEHRGPSSLSPAYRALIDMSESEADPVVAPAADVDSDAWIDDLPPMCPPAPNGAP